MGKQNIIITVYLLHSTVYMYSFLEGISMTQTGCPSYCMFTLLALLLFVAFKMQKLNDTDI